MRMNGSYNSKEYPNALSSSSPFVDEKRPFGFSSLSLDPSRTSVFASCMNDTIYQYLTCHLQSVVKQFHSESFQCSTFYIKTCVSPCGRFISSGSSDSNLHIWEIQGPLMSPYLLSSHSKEITGCDWSRDKVNF